MSSLVPNTPVKLNNVVVTSEKTPVPNQQVLTVGSCSFRFEYLKPSISPLQEANTSTVTVTPSKVELLTEVVHGNESVDHGLIRIWVG